MTAANPDDHHCGSVARLCLTLDGRAGGPLIHVSDTMGEDMLRYATMLLRGDVEPWVVGFAVEPGLPNDPDPGAGENAEG